MSSISKFFVFGSLCYMFLLAACGSSTQEANLKPSPTAIHHETPVVATKPTDLPGSTPAVGVPLRLLIPRIGVNAPIEDAGITAQGDLATPTKNPWDDVGWYSNGPRPGEQGSAVINGHLDRPGGYPAVFWNLRQLHAGDEVLIVNAQGKSVRFRVARIASYPPQEAPLEDIFSATGGAYLNLITCAGTWIPAQHQTTLRLVVYTTLA
jgi:LPXTG-site transpeptidase (sortase) family protein